MGISLCTITGHRLSADEIVDYQDVIESDKTLNDLWFWSKKRDIEKWVNIADKERIENFWEHNETQVEVDGVFMFDHLTFPTFFGEITFHRNILELCSFGIKLWTLESRNDLSGGILNFNNRLSELFEQTTLIYYGDSWAKSSWIGDLIYDHSLDQIEQQLYSQGYKKGQSIDEAVNNEHV